MGRDGWPPRPNFQSILNGNISFQRFDVQILAQLFIILGGLGLGIGNGHLADIRLTLKNLCCHLAGGGAQVVIADRQRCNAAALTDIFLTGDHGDLLFPAVVRSYFEAICVGGVTFNFNDGRPNSLCKAKRLIYVTTAGGPIFKNLGFEYVDALCRTFFEINDTLFIKAEGLDITGVDQIAILEKAKKEIKL